MFISGEIFAKLKADLEKDLVELVDGGKTLLINGKVLIVHTYGDAVERFHTLTELAKADLYGKIKADAAQFSKAIEVAVDKVEEKVEVVAEEVKVKAKKTDEKIDEVVDKVNEDIQEMK